MYLSPTPPGGLGCCPVKGGSSVVVVVVVVDLLFNVLPVVCRVSVFIFISLCITL